MRVPFSRPPALQVPPTVIAAGVAGAVGGVAGVGAALLSGANPLYPFALLGGLVALLPLPLLLTRPLANLLIAIGIIVLLPFATLPVKIGLTPTFLELALLLGLGVWAFMLARRPELGLVRSPLDLPLLGFIGITLFALLLGLWRDFAPDIVHNYFKTLLGLTIFFSTVQIVRTPAHLQWVLRALIGGGALAAGLGVILWRLPDALAARLLSALRVVGYPTTRVIRYVEDDPAKGERATGTAVDPNSFGALLAVLVALTLAQAVARQPIFPRPLLWAALAVEGLALYATQSRTALLAALAGAGLIGLLRYRRLLLVGGVIVGLALALGLGGSYLARLQSGLALQDQAQLMRLAEYRNALTIIERYPLFGVGFGRAGELDLTTGVSSIYLTIAERTGLIGLAAFALVLGLFFALTLPPLVRGGGWGVGGGRSPADDSPALRTPHSALRNLKPPTPTPPPPTPIYDAALLGATAAVLAALVEGVADHPFFNIEYAHMVALFWLCVALAVIARQGVITTRRTAAPEVAR